MNVTFDVIYVWHNQVDDTLNWQPYFRTLLDNAIVLLNSYFYDTFSYSFVGKLNTPQPIGGGISLYDYNGVYSYLQPTPITLLEKEVNLSWYNRERKVIFLLANMSGGMALYYSNFIYFGTIYQPRSITLIHEIMHSYGLPHENPGGITDIMNTPSLEEFILAPTHIASLQAQGFSIRPEPVPVPTPAPVPTPVPTPAPVPTPPWQKGAMPTNIITSRLLLFSSLLTFLYLIFRKRK